ncbi:hypothetical protein O181_126116 [Austropuccinia psidii MF-1]|uniref:Reverse transcriptase Ty1/copia-type domain-containing protein n=1 Tax=Austropuccinia psidii MF-1 TaxID=1389203 RepID=A0A9Q3Q5M5_9BASI|nr:hypothetical protein [Austropuccinia psidii MF-1]
MHQEDFCKKILDEFNMTNSNPIKTPTPMNIRHVLEAESPPMEASYVQKAIGMLSYLALHTRPDIAFTVNVLSQHVNKPTSAKIRELDQLELLLVEASSILDKPVSSQSSFRLV